LQSLQQPWGVTKRREAEVPGHQQHGKRLGSHRRAANHSRDRAEGLWPSHAAAAAGATHAPLVPELGAGCRSLRTRTPQRAQNEWPGADERNPLSGRHGSICAALRARWGRVFISAQANSPGRGSLSEWRRKDTCKGQTSLLWEHFPPKAFHLSACSVTAELPIGSTQALRE